MAFAAALSPPPPSSPPLLPEMASPSHPCSRFSPLNRSSSWCCCRVRVRSRWHVRVSATSLRVLDANVNGHSFSLVGVEIPVTCYQIIGVPDKTEKDQIVKSVMDLKNADVEEGYTTEAVTSRRDLLMDVRDKLLFEPEYAGNVKEKIPPKSSLQIPWGWLPGALCLLQEVGEEKFVLEIGRSALQYQDAKPHVHDLLLSMALAECAIAKAHFEKNQVPPGFEALARAQCLLRSTVSMGKMKLLSEIEESLEGLAPACTLELLALPQTPDNAERRRGAIAALRELLRQGLDVEASCQVHDWSGFLSQALGKLMAAEIVDLIPWDLLATTRKNKKSLESQNQRVVIDFDCFYTALMAYIAFGFSSGQIDLISQAMTICECLLASDGKDLKLEEAFCSFLLGQRNEAEALERLRQLETNKKQASRSSILGKEAKDGPATDYSLENWLKDAVLYLFSDTRDCSPSLGSFFGREKKAIIGNKQSRGVSYAMPNLNHRMISPAVSSDRIVSDECLASLVSSQHLGPAVKQLAPSNLRSPLREPNRSNQSDVSISSPQIKRGLGRFPSAVTTGWMVQGHLIRHITFATVLGIIVFATAKMLGRPTGSLNQPRFSNRKASWTIYSSHHYCPQPNDNNYNFAGGMKQLFSNLKMKISNQDSVNQQKAFLTSSLSSPVSVVFNRAMPVEEAEALVRQWQVIKAEALGPDHQIHFLDDILDEPMLLEWQALADAAKTKSCFWRFVLLQLSVLRADILLDTAGPEIAEIDVLLEEAAELVDDNQQKNPNYYSSYRISYILRRQDDGSWKFCKAIIDVLS